MAIIKCPECGRQISENAPVCPNCGVEIKGKIVRCTQCGEVYFNEQEVCPACHHTTYSYRKPEPQPDSSVVNASAAGSQASASGNRPATAPVPPPVPPTGQSGAKEQKKSESGKVIFLVALTIALLLGGCFFYFYNNAKTDKELQNYEFALRSNDPLVLQTYLDNNKDAPQDHLAAITKKLQDLQQQDNEWDNAVVSGSKAALQDYMSKHPDSEHLVQARHLVDSIDWTDAQNENTIEALQGYLNEHAQGEHVSEAERAIKKIKSTTVQSDEKSMIVSSLRRFFQSINSKDEDRLQSSVAPVMTSFLGKADATQGDVVTFMHKIYKEDITNMNWKLNGDYKIDKKEVGEDRYEFTVKYSAVQTIERGEENRQDVRYQLTSVINPDGQISSMSMTRLEE